MLVERATRPTTAARDLRAWYVRDLGLSVLPLSCMAAAQRSNSLIATNSAVRGRARLKISQAGDLGCRTRATRLCARCVARSCVYAQSARKQQPASFDVDHIVDFFLKIIFSILASLRRCAGHTAETRASAQKKELASCKTLETDFAQDLCAPPNCVPGPLPTSFSGRPPSL